MPPGVRGRRGHGGRRPERVGVAGGGEPGGEAKTLCGPREEPRSETDKETRVMEE